MLLSLLGPNFEDDFPKYVCLQLSLMLNSCLWIGPSPSCHVAITNHCWTDRNQIRNESAGRGRRLPGRQWWCLFERKGKFLFLVVVLSVPLLKLAAFTSLSAELLRCSLPQFILFMQLFRVWPTAAWNLLILVLWWLLIKHKLCKLPRK